MRINWLNLMNLSKKYYDTENKLFLKEKEIYDKTVSERSNKVKLN